MKVYGAQKIYCARQDPIEQSEGSSSAVDELKSQLKASNQALVVTRRALDDLSTQCSMIMQYQEATKSRANTIAKLADLHRQINSIESSRSDATETDAFKVSGDELHAKIDQLVSELNKRRRIGKEMISQISDQCDMSRAALIGDLGLEMTCPRGS